LFLKKRIKYKAFLKNGCHFSPEDWTGLDKSGYSGEINPGAPWSDVYKGPGLARGLIREKEEEKLG